MKQFNFNTFVQDANYCFLKHKQHQRYGQFLMNYISMNYPEITIPQELDPFYQDTKVPEFLKYLHSISE